MRTVSLRLVDMAKAVIPIGIEGENEFTTVRIDCKKMLDQHPSAIPSLTVKDPAGNIYPAVVTLDGTIAEWRVTASDLTRKGEGEIQLSFTIDGSVIGKSDPAKTRINRSLESNGGIPEPIQNWIDEANIILGEIPVTIAESVDTALTAAKESGEFDGDDGVSPVVTVEAITGGHRVTVTDAEGDHPFEVLDGEDGDPGHTPVITASKSGSTTTIMVDGVAVAQISDGQDGDPGHSPVVTASKSGKVTTISVDGTPIATINDGLDGDPTALIDDTAGPGATGKTWSADKIAAETSALLTEINSKYEKPSGGIPSSDMTDAVQTSLGKADSAYQKPQTGIPATDLASDVIPAVHNVPSGGTTGQVLKKSSGTDYEMAWADASPVETVSGSTPSITGVAGTRYICGECATLSITAPASGCIDIVFESGSTATVLTVSSAKTGVTAIKWANGFDPSSLEANATYELNILDGEYGVSCSWT